MISEYDKSILLYKNALIYDNCNFEAIACIGAHHFYSDQPEIAIKFYKRLFELGLNSAELWNNLGLCAYYSGQYDICLSCFERGLLVADDPTSAEIWYNISHVSIGLGDLSLAYQALKISISFNPDHFEAFNNLGVLSSRIIPKSSRTCWVFNHFGPGVLEFFGILLPDKTPKLLNQLRDPFENAWPSCSARPTFNCFV